VETNVTVLESLWQKEVVEYGFRPPRSDIDIPNHGPDGRVDVYLADLVDRGILGYCAPERPPNYQSFNASGYCVLDNDYTPAQVGAPGLAGLLELELTAVHEFFHDIQFGYDASDDVWLLEGTATWIEDEAFPNVYEAYNRFPYSALRQPQVPVDFVSATKPYQYGSWVFWRFLEELLAPDASHYAPQVIRRVWELADASPGGPDMYSLQAVEAVLAEHGIPFRTAFLDFALANFRPASFYREGKTWPAAPVQRVQRIGSGGRASATLRLDHLSSRYVAFVPGRGARAGSQLSLNLDLPVLGKAPAAAALVYSRRGAPSTRRIPLSLAGNGSIRVPFGSKQVSRVVLVLVNASDRYRCWGFRSRMSCQGTPLDDKAPYRYSARVS
jgi:hypothetical protein